MSNNVQRYYQLGTKLWNQRNPAIMGLCYMNGFFTRPNIVNFANHVSDHSRKVYIFVPTVAARFTYEAVHLTLETLDKSGRSKDYKRSMNKRTKYFNNTLKTLDTLCEKDNIEIVDFRKMGEHPAFQHQLKYLFKNDVLKDRYIHVTQDIIQRNVAARLQNQNIDPLINPSEIVVPERVLQLGFNSVIYELAFYWSCCEVLGEEFLVDCYHKKTPILEEVAPPNVGGKVINI